MSVQPDVIVLGGGLAGLSAAWHLKKAGKKVLLLEKSTRVGGAVRSVVTEGYTLEKGANSAALTPDLEQWIQELGLSEQMIMPSTSAENRFITRDGKLHPVKPALSWLLRTSLLSIRGKLRLAKEPWIRSQSPGRESVRDFFTRRLGEESYQYLINPVIGGIYAGNPGLLGIESVMPTVVEMEKDHGSLFKALNARRGTGASRQIFSISGGLGQLAKAAHQSLEDEILTEAEVLHIRKAGEGTEVVYRRKQQEITVSANSVVWALPAFASDVLGADFLAAAQLLQEIRYVPMGMLHLGFNQSDVSSLPDGFGFLTPESEDSLVMGAIWNSKVFPETAPDQRELITVFVGGGRTMLQSESHLLEVIPEVITRLSDYLNITDKPIFCTHHYWNKAIPQYGLQHVEILQKISSEESSGLYFCGNALNGVSVGAVVEQGKAAAGKIIRDSPNITGQDT